MWSIRKFLEPTPFKVLVTVLSPAVVAYLVTFQVDSVFSFYGWLLTPTITVYDGVLHTEFNLWVLAWVPLYLFSCLAEALLRRPHLGLDISSSSPISPHV